MRLKSLFVIILTTIGMYATPQEMAGLVHSNHAGTDVLFSNPAGLHHQKDWLSIHLFTGDIFFSNNYLFFDKKDINYANLASGDPSSIMHSTGYGDKERPFYIYNKKRNTRSDIGVKLQGLAGMYIQQQHAFAVFSGVRSMVHIHNITPELGRFIYYGLGYIPQHDKVYYLKDFNSSMITYSELGFSYAYQWNRAMSHNWNFGMSVKRLSVLGGYYLHIDNARYNVINDSTLDIQALDADMGVAYPGNPNVDFSLDNINSNGKGWALDIGVEYQKLIRRQSKSRVHQKACMHKYWDYKYRIGVSLMDFGVLTLKKDTELHEYLNTDYTWYEIDTLDYVSLHQFFRELSARFYGDPNASKIGSVFRMWPSTSLNISGDYNFENGLYLNASLVYNLSFFGGFFVRKPNILSVTPRFERPNFELALPLSVYYGWRPLYPRIGIAMRFYYVTIGSDNIISLVRNKIKDLNVFVSIKFNLRKGSCNKRGSIDPCDDSF